MAEAPDSAMVAPSADPAGAARAGVKVDVARLVALSAELLAQNEMLRKALWCIQAELAEREPIFDEEDKTITELPRTLADVAPNVEQIIRYAFHALHPET